MSYSIDLFNVIIMIYLIIDAPKHGKRPFLWGILGLLFGVITLIVYLFQTGRNRWGFIWLIIFVLLTILAIGFVIVILHAIFGPLFHSINPTFLLRFT